MKIIITYKNNTQATFTHYDSIFKDKVFLLTLQVQEKELKTIEFVEGE